MKASEGIGLQRFPTGDLRVAAEKSGHRGRVVRFRLQTDYALKALLFLARRGDANSTTEEIADFYGISAAHLGRVIRRLQKYGLVKAIRGRRGGVRLNREPQHLTLGEIVETLEEGGSLAEPADGEKPEAREQASRLRAVLRRAQGLFTNYLSKATVADLVSDLPEPISVHGESIESLPASAPAPAPEPVAVSGPGSENAPYTPTYGSPEQPNRDGSGYPRGPQAD